VADSAAVRVLVGEDQPLVREGIVRVLEVNGFRVVATAGNAPDLVRKAAVHRPNVVITDIQMPPDSTDDGLRAALEIRAADPTIGVLVLSQFLEDRYAFDLVAGGAGGVGYLLNEPMCLHSNSGMSYRGSCPAPEAPPQFVSTRGAVPLYLAVSVGLDVQAAPPPAPGAPPDPERSVWYGGPAVLADLSVLVFGALAARHDDGLFAFSAAAYFLGGPANHIARGHNKRGLGSLGIRAAGAAVAAATLAGIIVGCVGESEGNNCGPWAVLLPLGPLAAMIIDDAYLSREPL